MFQEILLSLKSVFCANRALLWDVAGTGRFFCDVAGCLSMPAEPEMEAVGATPVPKNEDPKGLYERNIE